jgi:hypothetical protein
MSGIDRWDKSIEYQEPRKVNKNPVWRRGFPGDRGFPSRYTGGWTFDR